MYATDTAAKQEAANLKFQAAQGEADAKASQGEAIVEAERIRKAAKSQRATATAAAAASGVDVSSPTAVRIDEQITASSEEDALLTILNGKDRSDRMNQQAKLDRTSASMARSNARTANVGTLLSGAAKGIGTYTNWKKNNG
jgi:hypothetical protein